MRTDTKKWRLIEQSKRIMGEYDLKLTLRQLFYRLVSAGIIPNTEYEYKYLSASLVDARLSGELSLDALEDRVRPTNGGDYGEWSVEDYLTWQRNRFERAWESYHLPKWKGQPKHLEVWVEKDALSALFGQVTERWNVVLGVCRGYASLSFIAEALRRWQDVDNEIHLIYFGDFDPSGEDIARYIQERAADLGLVLHFQKYALTPAQIAQYQLLPMPAKKSDSRAQAHIARYGDVAVELDALDPRALQGLIDKAIAQHFDRAIYKRVEAEEEARRHTLKEQIESMLAR